jgi:hypothetical protein
LPPGKRPTARKARGGNVARRKALHLEKRWVKNVAFRKALHRQELPVTFTLFRIGRFVGALLADGRGCRRPAPPAKSENRALLFAWRIVELTAPDVPG